MIFIVIWLHWLSDFVLQTDKMAKGKSTSNGWLLIHINVYTIPFLILGWKYALLNGAAHLVVDFVTSRITSYLWKQNRVHDFFVIIGLDQAIHLSVLIALLPLAEPVWLNV